MALVPKPGLVVQYDFLWKEESATAHEHGTKDRPCAIVLTTKEREDGSKDVYLCAITHSPPSRDEAAVEVPDKVARHLGLDHERCWIKTHQVNVVSWPKDQIPYGIAPTRRGEWSYGQLPRKLGKQVFDQLQEQVDKRTLGTVRRE